MAKPLAIVSWVGNGVGLLLTICLVIWVIILYGKLGDHKKHECNNPPPPSNCSKCNEAVSTQFSLNAKLSIKQLEFNSSCLMSMKDLGFIDTKICLDDLTKFEVNEADNCIKQKDYIDTDNSYNLSAVVKNTDTNETMKLMVTFNVAAAGKSVFKTNELVFVDKKKGSADLEVEELYTTYKSDNSKVQTKIQSLNGTTNKITLDRSDLNDTNELVVIANNGVIFKKALIKVCYLNTTDLPDSKMEELKYNKTDTANKMSVKAVTNSSCTIDTTYSASDSQPYEVKADGEITLLKDGVAANKTFLVTAKTVVGESKKNVTIIVV